MLSSVHTNGIMNPEPLDRNGKNLKAGDWVRVMAVPLSIRNMADDSKAAFCHAVGKTLQIETIEEVGSLELEFWHGDTCHTVFLEPYCVERFRRYKKLSRKFQKILALNEELNKPRYSFKYTVIWPDGGSYEECIHIISDCTSMDVGFGGSVNIEERRMEGDFSILIHKKHSLELITQCRQSVLSIDYFDNIEVGEIFVDNSRSEK